MSDRIYRTFAEINLADIMHNGEVAKKPEVKVDTSDEVTWKGTPVVYVEYEYIMLNKPSGYVTTHLRS